MFKLTAFDIYIIGIFVFIYAYNKKYGIIIKNQHKLAFVILIYVIGKMILNYEIDNKKESILMDKVLSMFDDGVLKIDDIIIKDGKKSELNVKNINANTILSNNIKTNDFLSNKFKLENVTVDNLKVKKKLTSLGETILNKRPMVHGDYVDFNPGTYRYIS
jgi:hypothetical protein